MTSRRKKQPRYLWVSFVMYKNIKEVSFVMHFMNVFTHFMYPQ